MRASLTTCTAQYSPSGGVYWKLRRNVSTWINTWQQRADLYHLYTTMSTWHRLETPSVWAWWTLRDTEYKNKVFTDIKPFSCHMFVSYGLNVMLQWQCHNNLAPPGTKLLWHHPQSIMADLSPEAQHNLLKITPTLWSLNVKTECVNPPDMLSQHLITITHGAPTPW